MAERIRCWPLEKLEGGREILVYRTLLPFILSNRIMISCMYHKEDAETGQVRSIQSSRGNEHFYEKYADQVGNDVVVNHIISMTRLRPMPDGKGVDVAQVINVDP